MSAPTLDDLWRRGRDRLRTAGIDTPELDARVLLRHAAGLSREALVLRGGETAAPEVAAAFDTLVAARLAGRPVARLIGRREFYGVELALGPATLEPRPDTETLVGAVLARTAPDRGMRITDLGTGTGAVLIALLLARPRARGIGTDISMQALAVARANARAAGLGGRAGFVASAWAARSLPRADVLVSNPPYIGRGEISALPREVRGHDPLRALVAGGDGLSAFRAIARALPRLVVPGGLIALEIGHAQAGAVTRILHEAGARLRGPGLGVVRDLAGRDRVVVARAPFGRQRPHGCPGMRRSRTWRHI